MNVNAEKLIEIAVYISVFFLNAWIVQTAWNNMEFGSGISYWQATGLLILCDILFKDGVTIKGKIDE
jgi:hypothetical protein